MAKNKMAKSALAAVMRTARLHGPRDIRIEQVTVPGKPGRGEALIRVTAVGICGSDLHTYTDGRIGDVVVKQPLTLGHEFAGVIDAVGTDARDGFGRLLKEGQRVAVDPSMNCGACEFCERGNPNFCLNLKFCGSYPDDGCLCDYICMPSRCCFPVPDDLNDDAAVMLEPLGIALHATDLARVKVGTTAVILGAGPIGLFLLQTVKAAGATRVYISDKFEWRLKLAKKLGGIPINCDKVDQVKFVNEATDGRGVDVTLEAAWADHSVEQAIEMTRRGGTVVLVGISAHDKVEFKHSAARRRGLTMFLVRRMKQTYPRALELARHHAVDLTSMVTHHVRLEDVGRAMELNAAYKGNVIKIIVDMNA